MSFYKTKIRYEIKENNFHGVYWENKIKTNKVILVMLGDDSEDYMAKSGAKWVLKQGFNCLTFSCERHSYSWHNFPLERFESALNELKKLGNTKFGIAGASTTGTIALTVSSIYKEFTLTLAFTPSDYIWQGFEQGKRDKAKEWPIDNESLLTLNNKPLAYMPFIYQHPKYYEIIKEEAKKNRSITASRKIFDDSEKANPIKEEQFIKVENINGTLVLIGAKDDILWDTVRYIDRIKERLSDKKTNLNNVYYLTYEHGTHFIFPQSLIKQMLKIGSSLFIKFCFYAERKYHKECIKTRKDIDKNILGIMKNWNLN